MAVLDLLTLARSLIAILRTLSVFYYYCCSYAFIFLFSLFLYKQICCFFSKCSRCCLFVCSVFGSVDLCCEINLHHHNIIIRADLSYKRLILWATFLWFAFFENSFLYNFNETTVWSPAKQKSDGFIVQTKLRIRE